MKRQNTEPAKTVRKNGVASQLGVDMCARVAGRGASRKIICAGFELKKQMITIKSGRSEILPTGDRIRHGQAHLLDQRIHFLFELPTRLRIAAPL